MKSLLVFYLFYILNNAITIVLSASDVKGFDDTVLFKINWPTINGADLLDMPDSESMIVTSSNKEKYKCIIPNPQDNSKDLEDNYEGPNALDILHPFFLESSCTYRLETYWTYEVCHGRYVRQYHEDREVTKTKSQEFYLGRWDNTAQEKLSKELDSGLHYPPPVKRLDGLNLPYLQLNLTDGSLCDLNGQPRRTNVLYVCYAMGKHDVYSFKETSTCHYEVIILSPLLCQHPKYVPQDNGEHVIKCLALDGASRKPRNLRKIEGESFKLRSQKLLDEEKFKKVFAVFSVNSLDKDAEGRIRLELRAISDENQEETTPVSPNNSPALIDASPVKNFLSGKDCLQGGSGWWKFEFCYGRYVEQYHMEPDHSRTVVRLGIFDLSTHIAWLAKNPHKRPKPLAERKQVSHFYSGGTTCEKTGQPRETEVKLKCVEKNSAGAVSLYLIEPHTCQYILGVESPLVCQMLLTLDQYGLIDDTDEATVTDEVDSDDDPFTFPDVI